MTVGWDEQLGSVGIDQILRSSSTTLATFQDLIEKEGRQMVANRMA